MQGSVGPETESADRRLVTCGCGVEFKGWVTPEEADEAPLVSPEPALQMNEEKRAQHDGHIGQELPSK